VKIQTVLGTIVALGTIAGGIMVVDIHYAKSAEIMEIAVYINGQSQLSTGKNMAIRGSLWSK